MKKSGQNFHLLPLPLFAQAFYLREQYPHFEIKCTKDTISVRFTVIDKSLSQPYKVLINYKSPWDHWVRLESPIIRPYADIHMYPSGNLCLYYPDDISPFTRIILGLHLVRWTYKWIFSYELWKVNGNVWPTESVPHNMHIISPYKPTELAKFSIYDPARKTFAAN